MAIEKSLLQNCIRNEDGICHYLESDLVPCKGLCANFKSFDEEVRLQINSKIKHADNKVKKGEPVTIYHLNMAFSHMSKDETTQGTLE